MAARCRSDSAPVGCAPQDKRCARCLPGKWQTITERGSDGALSEIHAELREMRMNVGHAAALAPFSNLFVGCAVEGRSSPYVGQVPIGYFLSPCWAACCFAASSAW